MKHLNIAMLGHKRIPSREGGIEVVVEELSTRMVNLGHDVTCYNRRGHHVSGQEFTNVIHSNYKGVRVKSVFTINKKGIAALTASVSGAIHAAFGKYDVIHFHAEGPCIMLWFPKLLGKRCIATVHGLDHKRAKWGMFASLFILLGERCAVRFADEIIVLSEGVKEYFFKTYGRDTTFIPNGVSRSEDTKANIIKKFGLEKDNYILFLGRIVPEKGLRYLVKAFKSVKTDKKLVIAGGSSDTDEFLKELKIMAQDDDRVIFTGFVEGETLHELYSNAYMYTLPSDLEGMPLSLLEAMSYGNCCLTSDIAECSEIVENNGIVFKKSDVNDLKEKIQFACDNESIVAAYKKNAAHFICNKYNWDEVVNMTLNLYKGKD